MIDFVGEWAQDGSEARGVVEARIAKAAPLLRAEWAACFEDRDVSAQGVRRFYETSRTAVYDMLGRARLAQAEGWPQVCGQWLKRHGCRSVVDFGCGLGAFGFGLAEQGFEVTLAELSGRHYGLLERIAERFPQATVCHPEGITGEGAHAPLTFDAIVCLEVMEHVFEPRCVTAGLMKRLRPGGIFFASWSFPQGSPDNPLHLRGAWTNEGYQQFLEDEFGLEWLNPGPCWARVLRKP